MYVQIARRCWASTAPHTTPKQPNTFVNRMYICPKCVFHMSNCAAAFFANGSAQYGTETGPSATRALGSIYNVLYRSIHHYIRKTYTQRNTSSTPCKTPQRCMSTWYVCACMNVNVYICQYDMFTCGCTHVLMHTCIYVHVCLCGCTNCTVAFHTNGSALHHRDLCQNCM